jgi:shikimate kinase
MGHIWLVGMMGSGKTTVGVLVAQILGRPFVDTDDAVMERTGRTIPELFDDSEATFRGAESMVIAETAVLADSVVATGGGSILSQDNIDIMERSGTIVLLEADEKTIAQRAETAADRPLLDDAHAIGRILAERAEAYHQAAGHTVSTAGRTPDEIAGEVASCVDM